MLGAISVDGLYIFVRSDTVQSLGVNTELLSTLHRCSVLNKDPTNKQYRRNGKGE